MAVIRPFHGLRYAPAAGPLEDLVAPPYDVLSQQDRDAYARKNPHNIVHLTLPEQHPDDRSKFVKYGRSAAALAQWRRDGVLRPEETATFYRYSQTFALPGTGETFTRVSLIGLIKVEPYDKGVVLPHEQTFPKHKEDRLRILEATRSHLECIFGLFEDPGRTVFDLISGAMGIEGAQVTTDDGVEHILERIDDPETVASISHALADKKVWIADGHHRYETALAFRQALGDREGLVAEDFMMMALSSMSDPGLVLLPTHRVVSKLEVNENQIDNVLQAHFHVRKASNAQLPEELASLGASGSTAFGVALPSGIGLVLTLEDREKASELIDAEESPGLKSLDVTILHRLIFERVLGIKGLEGIAYTRDANEAIEAVSQGAAASFLMNPPTVDDMRRIALGGEKMPQKSTYYYPKILSGLVLWSLGDWEG
ncbi:MAG TPA: DUF1015 domain-containing protein [Fimbriimonadaceae bacterium]|nr:DUF1015 domain-containing protein [Fimbriimonadaceae bacterium]